MSLSRALLAHSLTLSVMEHSGETSGEMRDVSLRRAVSAAYYAIFHRIIAAAVALIAPNVPASTNHRIQRWFEHAEMKKVCGRFLQTKMDQPLLGLIGPAATLELQDVCSIFIRLQDARHRADYDLGYKLTSAEAHQLVTLAVSAIASWDQIATSAEANVFILSLLMIKNWDKDR